MIMKNWGDICYFIAVAETGSLKAAATRLECSQPTIGRRIEALEASLAITLFQRNAHGLTLTREGNEVLPHAKKIEYNIASIIRTITCTSEDLSATVIISVPEGLCNELLIHKVVDFYQLYPRIKLILDVSSSATDLALGKADLAIRLYRSEQNNLVVKRLGTMKMGLYASKDYLAKNDYPRSLDDLKKHRFIIYGNELADLLENQWLQEYVSCDNCILATDNTTARINATVNGIGISIQPALLVEKNKKLINILPEIKLPEHKIWITYHSDLRNTKRIRKVIEFITTVFTI